MIKGALINRLEEGESMQLIIVIILFFFNLYQNIKSIEYQSKQKECICECCLDNNENCLPTFRSAININPLLECNSITCNQQSCLTFSQCSIAFGKTVASCQNRMIFSSSTGSTNTSRQEVEKKIRCIPIEDAISIEYLTDL
ncbi:unnamed protein product [Rotaria sordida]|uniref:Uncharacterized protein n=1 Tax=Rotaria sordida TaxID=392033 RepID=A0A814B1F6_9BILA|nr:unnamed protein product [Rotaria sordida]CAF0996351.1 unnamed protein product [Rotaria sordida]